MHYLWRNKEIGTAPAAKSYTYGRNWKSINRNPIINISKIYVGRDLWYECSFILQKYFTNANIPISIYFLKAMNIRRLYYSSRVTDGFKGMHNCNPFFPHGVNSLIGVFILIEGSESTIQLRIKNKKDELTCFIAISQNN